MIKRYSTELSALPAYNGDCILIKTFLSNNDEFIILIDGGTSATFQYSLKREVETLTKIDLVILTHIDSDHIGGLIKFLKSSLIEQVSISEIWVNHPERISISTNSLISFAQGDTFNKFITEKLRSTKVRSICTADRYQNFDHLLITILSPTAEILYSLKENWPVNDDVLPVSHIAAKLANDNIPLRDLSVVPFKANSTIEGDLINASSIAFILDCPGCTFLMLADSRAEIVEAELRKLGIDEESPLTCEFVKISHHGSKNNTSETLLGILRCSNFIISTNGGSAMHSHPSRETIAKLIFASNRDFEKKLNIYMNYPLEAIIERKGSFISNDDTLEGNWTMEYKITHDANATENN